MISVTVCAVKSEENGVDSGPGDKDSDRSGQGNGRGVYVHIYAPLFFWNLLRAHFSAAPPVVYPSYCSLWGLSPEGTSGQTTSSRALDPLSVSLVPS